ncbi:MAG: hypothetical protein ACIARR_03615 [Phycisphaerales bacterium JB059]
MNRRSESNRYKNEQHDDLTLSPAGRARRDEMLPELRRRVRSRGRRRRATRAALTTLPLLALVLVIAWPARHPPRALPPTDPGSPTLTQTTPPGPTPTPTLTRVDFTLVQTHPDRGASPISDAELLDLLHQAGHTDAGLARLPGRVVLTGDSLAQRRAPAPSSDPPGPGA